MIFNSGYYSAMDQQYDAGKGMTFPEERVTTPSSNIEKPVLRLADIGQSVTEGSRFGTFLQSANAAMRGGAGKIELQTQMGGGAEPVGAEAYGKDARQALREMKEANKIEFTSVHAPTQIGNMSGFNPQQGFSDDQREAAVKEIKRAIDFAGDVAGGGAVVIHTGEYPRPISEAEWAREKNLDGTFKRDAQGNYAYKFLGYPEEPGRAITYMVDRRTGQIIRDVRKSQIIREPVYKESDHDSEGKDVDGKQVRIYKGDWVTEEGDYINPKNPEHLFKRVPIWDESKTRFQTRKLAWREIEERTEWYNKKNPEKPITPEEMAFRIQMETQMLQYRGSSLFHGRFYEEEIRARDVLKEKLEYYEELEKQVPENEAWRILKKDIVGQRYIPAEFVEIEYKKPTEILKKALREVEQSIQYTHEASSSADAQADQIQDTLEHVVPVSKYAKDQSSKSYAEAGVHAMIQSDENPHVKRDIFVAPENIFPEMGYGSHPEELIELVQRGREEMVKFLTEKQLPDQHERRDIKGELIMIDNPYYRKGMSKEQAWKEAQAHIKATFDTQHLGMWRRNFVPLYLKEQGRMETPQETDTRFSGWYKDQVKLLHEKGVLGHIHMVDAMGSQHQHLPVGQGVLPVVDAITYLKKHGYEGTITSEGHGEEQLRQGRILTEAWRAFNSPVYSAGYWGGPPEGRTWIDVQHSYFGRTYPPNFIFGAYSPSNDWTLWSEVPLE